MLTHVGDLDPLAVVGGRCFTGLRDVTSDLSALDSSGFWVVALSFEGDVACARFDGAGLWVVALTFEGEAVCARFNGTGPVPDAWP
ncbi:MAG: hypothetical protein JO085_05455, partial [Acidimicrobiia bacterium]|nr:hypothetical protein [Acidimicrobiia bacterium]